MEVGDRCILVIDVGSRDFTYEGKIIKIDDFFVEFIDKYNKKWIYNKRYIKSCEVIIQ